MGCRFQSRYHEAFSLHDCRSDHIEYADNRLTVFFPCGIFFEEYGDDWPNTGPASVEYLTDPMGEVRFYLFTETDGQTIRREYTLEQLIQKVNAGEWELEFAYRYEGYQEVLHICWVWQDREPWSCEAQLFIGTKEAEIFRYDPPAQEKRP